MSASICKSLLEKLKKQCAFKPNWTVFTLNFKNIFIVNEMPCEEKVCLFYICSCSEQIMCLLRIMYLDLLYPIM